MALKIGPSTPASGIQQARDALQRSLEKLGSGRRINQAQDDAAGLALSEQLNAAERSHAQGQRNLSDGISLTRTAEGALGQSSDILSRMRELSVQAGNGVLGDDARSALQKEYDSLGEELTRIADSTQFNGRKLLNGDTSGAGAVTLRDGTGGSDVVQVSLEDHSAGSLGVEGLDVSDPATLDALDQAASTVSSTRADLGSTENRLEAGIRNLQSIRESTMAAGSRIRDADYAKQASELARSRILEQASVATQVQANLSAATALDLLR